MFTINHFIVTSQQNISNYNIVKTKNMFYSNRFVRYKINEPFIFMNLVHFNNYFFHYKKYIIIKKEKEIKRKKSFVTFSFSSYSSPLRQY